MLRLCFLRAALDIIKFYVARLARKMSLTLLLRRIISVLFWLNCMTKFELDCPEVYCVEN